MSVAARLAALEAEREAERQPSEINRYVWEISAKHEAAWEYMRPMMDPKRVAEVEAVWSAGGGRGYAMSSDEALACYVDRVLGSFASGGPAVQLNLPPEVAESIKANPFWLALHDCADCGFKVIHGSFDACPLCGGEIGWYAYYSKHGQRAPGVEWIEVTA